MHLILEILRYVFTWSLIALWVYGIQSTGERVPGTPGIKSWRGSHYYRYIRPKFAILWFKMFSTDHNEILHMSRQCNCRDVCKISLWSAEYIMNKTITKFNWISNSFETLLVGRAPCLTREDNLSPFKLNSYPCISVELTHWGRDKMDAISQTTFSRAFSSMKIVVFWLNFHWNLFSRVQLTLFQHWFR